MAIEVLQVDLSEKWDIGKLAVHTKMTDCVVLWDGHSSAWLVLCEVSAFHYPPSGAAYLSVFLFALSTRVGGVDGDHQQAHT